MLLARVLLAAAGWTQVAAGLASIAFSLRWMRRQDVSHYSSQCCLGPISESRQRNRYRKGQGLFPARRRRNPDGGRLRRTRQEICRLYAAGKSRCTSPKSIRSTNTAPVRIAAEIESFLGLGFGGGGHDLLKSYDVKYLGSETVNGARRRETGTDSEVRHSLRNNIARILLWIDPAKGISIQQQLFEPGGDYRLAKYSDIQINQKLPDDAFKLKTTAKTKFFRPQG